MDGSAPRASGIPRASRLPVPRAPGNPRPAFSTASSVSPARPTSTVHAPTATGPAGTRQLHNPKVRTSLGGTPLRTATSREQLRAASHSRPPAQRPSGGRASSTSQRRTSLFADGIPSRVVSTTADLEDDVLLSQDDASPIAEHAFDSAADGNILQTPRSRSLSERTMETLAHIPSSPAMSRKPSSFFDHARPSSRSGSGSSRPGSSYNSDGSGLPHSPSSSRPCSRAENDNCAAAFKSALATVGGTPDRSSNSNSVRTPKPRIGNKASLVSASRPLSVATSPNPERVLTQTPIKTQPGPVKSLKPKTTSNNLFKKPSLPAMNRNVSGSNAGNQTSRDGVSASLAPPKTRSTASGEIPGLTQRKSSAALREQIAKAKAARKASSAMDQSETGADSVPISLGGGMDFDMHHSDPFGQSRGQPAGAKVLQQRIAAGRTSGRLNIAALGLKEIPADVVNMYNLESVGSGGSWSESVDLTRLVAADNEFETIDDFLFPDTVPDDFSVDDDDSPPNIFGGLETMDLHGNKLASIPIGFRRLDQLTSLNLAKNNLKNDCLEILSQMKALRDLKLASNNLSGALNAAITLLDGVEVLDLHDNKLTSLPEDMHKMARLRSLDLGENSFESISFVGLSVLPLSQLTLKKNKLTGTLIKEPIEAMRSLQTLDISCNQIKYMMSSGTIVCFPVLHTLSASMNRLQELPDMSSWSSLLTLTVDENGISVIPDSFMTLSKLRQVDFSGNDIRAVPPELSRMDSLSMIRLSGNPLRDKKFVTASTDELKEILAGRLEPPPPYQEQGEQNTLGLVGSLAEADKLQGAIRGVIDVDNTKSDGEDDFTTPPTSRPQSPSRFRSETMDSVQTQFHMPVLEDWQVRPGGVLDRSRTGSTVLDVGKCIEADQKQAVRQLQLHHNLFSHIPSGIAVFSKTLASLSLANNQLVGSDYIEQPVKLPAITELSLASNRITSLEPLLEALEAHLLEKLDVSCNRITELPLGLLDRFPRLTVLLASNNQLSELRPAAIKGLKVVEVSSNDIGQLDPMIGLLGGSGGLERLDVSGNRFKVPRWNILEQGTHATLHWLRGRVPEMEMERWRKANGDDD